jgi:glycosyltransferase involved in cell wall biosynthesis
MPERVVDAVASLPALHGVALVFLGPCAPDYESSLRSRAPALHGDASIRFGSMQELPALAARLAASGCAVVLRKRSHGAFSPELLECVARGIPVVSNLPAGRDLPEGSAELLEPDPNVQSIAAAVERVLNDDGVRRGLQDAQAQAARTLTAQTTAEALLDFLVKGLQEGLRPRRSSAVDAEWRSFGGR